MLLISSNKSFRRCTGIVFWGVLSLICFYESSTAYAWDAPVAIDLNTSTGLRSDTQFKLAGEGDFRGVVWASNSEATADFGVQFSKSNDGGASWSAPVDLTGLNGVANGQFGDNPALAIDDSTWIAAWDACQVSSRSIDISRDIYIRRSTDAGQSWLSPRLVNSDHADTAVRNFTPVIGNDGAGTWVALWQSDIFDATDRVEKRTISMSRSVDGGANWSDVERLDTPTTIPLFLTANPVTDNNGVWLAAWEVFSPDPHIRVFRSVDNGQTWSLSADLDAGENAGDAKTFYNGQPELASDGAGNWVVVWTSNVGVDSETLGTDQIYCSRSFDGGATWSSSAPVSPGDHHNQTPDLVWDSGKLLTVWGGPAGFDAAASFDFGSSWVSAEAPGTQGSDFDNGENLSILGAPAAEKMAAWLYYAPGATGPDLVSSKESRSASADNWTLY